MTIAFYSALLMNIGFMHSNSNDRIYIDKRNVINIYDMDRLPCQNQKRN